MSDVILTEQQLSQLLEDAATKGAEVGVQAAFKWYENRIAKESEELLDRFLYNAKEILKNYRQCKAYVDNAVYDSDSEEETLEDIQRLMLGKVTVESIKTSVIRTKILFANVDIALRSYKNYCLTSNNPVELRRWRVIDALYISDEKKSAAELAREEKLVERQIYKDVTAACEILGPLIFGFIVIARGCRDGSKN